MGRVAQSVGHLTRKLDTQSGHILPFSADSRRAVISYWRKYVHEVLVNRLGGLSLTRKSVVRLTDRGHKTTTTKKNTTVRCSDVNKPMKQKMIKI